MWAIAGSWRWGWHHPEWRAALPEPSIPQMPHVSRSPPTAATWAQLDAVCHLAATHSPEHQGARVVYVGLQSEVKR